MRMSELLHAMKSALVAFPSAARDVSKSNPESAKSKQARRALSTPVGEALLWDGSSLFAPTGSDGPMEVVATWDPASRKARWAGKRRVPARPHVALDARISFACMSRPPQGATAEAREGQLRFGLANQSECKIAMEDALASSFAGGGNKREDSDVLFAASRSSLAGLAAAAKDLGLAVKSAQPFPSALARGALRMAGLEGASGPAGAFVPGVDGSWLFVFRGSELQWLFALHWGRDRWEGAAEKLLDAVEQFNDRESDAPMESLTILHGADDEWSASLASTQMEEALGSTGYFKVPTVKADQPGADVQRWLAMEGARHADH